MKERKTVPSAGLRLEDGFFGRGDEFYSALLAAHEGLDEEGSGTLNARLVLILANHIGDMEVLHQAIELARSGVKPRRG